MYVLTKDSVIYGSCEKKCCFKLQKNGYYIPCNLANATHFKVHDIFYNVKEYRLFEVEKLPEHLETDGSWVYELGEFIQDEGLMTDILRTKRDILLSETDWAICLDSPLDAETKSLVVHYRQALRDFPEQEGFPFEVLFPVSPLVLKD